MNKTGYQNIDSCDPRTCINSKIGRSQRIINSIFRKHVRQFGITSSQLSILFVLSKRGKCTGKELANILYLEKSSVSRNKRRMLEQEFLESEGSHILITNKGLELLEKVIPSWEKAMEETKKKLGNLGEESLNTIVSQLITN